MIVVMSIGFSHDFGDTYVIYLDISITKNHSRAIND